MRHDTPETAAADLVGPSGFVLGTDLAGGMLEAARQKARAQALSNIEFRAADAEMLDPEHLRPLLTRTGFAMEHVESMHVPVMEAEDGAGVVRWIRELGGPVAKLVEDRPMRAARPSWTTTYPGPRPQQGSHAAYALELKGG